MKKKKPTTKKTKASHLKQSKTPDFLKKLRQENSMIEYFSRLSILNPPAAKFLSSDSQTRREGSFVRLAHAKEEFTAPVLTKGKAVLAKQKEEALRRKKALKKPK